MDTLLPGIHHITLCPGSAQADVDFFTGVLGQRLVKQTVLLDGRSPSTTSITATPTANPVRLPPVFPIAAARAGRARDRCRW